MEILAKFFTLILNTILSLTIVFHAVCTPIRETAYKRNTKAENNVTDNSVHIHSCQIKHYTCAVIHNHENIPNENKYTNTNKIPNNNTS